MPCSCIFETPPSFLLLSVPAGFLDEAAELVHQLCGLKLDFQKLTLFGSFDLRNPRFTAFEIALPLFPRGIFITRAIWPGPFVLRVTLNPSVGFQLSMFAKFDNSKLEFLARFDMSKAMTISGEREAIPPFLSLGFFLSFLRTSLMSLSFFPPIFFLSFSLSSLLFPSRHVQRP